MLIWNSILQARRELGKLKQPTVVTIGNFDGVHLGHQAIMARTVEQAKAINGLSVALTFKNHTESLLGEKPLLINMPELRRELMSSQKLDALLEVEFNQQFSELSPELFFEKWLIEGLHTKILIVGHDFHFGKEGRGDFHLLTSLGKEFNITVEQIPPVTRENVVISSSKIRELLAEGKVEFANGMLGYPFVIAGEVVTGEQRGRKLGFPTANIHLLPEYLLPCYGVYMVRLTTVDNLSYFGMANVGINPTFGIHSPRVEVYLFDVEINLYHQWVRVEFLGFIRPENRFAGPEALKRQIERDIEAGMNMIDKL